MHIGINCYEYPPCGQGGVGTFTKDLAERLVQNGIQVTVFGIYYPRVLKLSSIVDEEINGVRVIRCPGREWKGFWRKFGAINLWIERIRLKRLVERLHREDVFDLVESPEATGWFPFGLSSVPLLTRFHGGQAFIKSLAPGPTSRMFRILERRQIIGSDFILSVSSFVGQKTMDVLGVDFPFTVIFNGINISQFSKLTDSYAEGIEPENLVLYYGSISPKKGTEELLRAAFNFLQGNDFTLGFAGKIGTKIPDGTLYVDFLRGLIPDEFSDRIKFYGPLDRERELIPLIHRSAICCFPSHVEAFGLAPVEAMAMGKSVIFTKSASGPEIVEDGVSGLLCDPRDTVELADKVSSLINDPQMRESMGNAARKRVEAMFDLEKIIEENITYYHKCLVKV